MKSNVPLMLAAVLLNAFLFSCPVSTMPTSSPPPRPLVFLSAAASPASILSCSCRADRFGSAVLPTDRVNRDNSPLRIAAAPAGLVWKNIYAAVEAAGRPINLSPDTVHQDERGASINADYTLFPESPMVEGILSKTGLNIENVIEKQRFWSTSQPKPSM